jgi:hypothetical protein
MTGIEIFDGRIEEMTVSIKKIRYFPDVHYRAREA